MSDEKETLRDQVRRAFAEARAGDAGSVDALCALYADDVHFEDPMQSIDGMAAFRRTITHLVMRARELRFDVAPAVGTDDECFFTWTMTLAMKVGPRTRVDGVTHLKGRDGKVASQRDYWDLGELAASAVPGGHRALRAALKPFT